MIRTKTVPFVLTFLHKFPRFRNFLLSKWSYLPSCCRLGSKHINRYTWPLYIINKAHEDQADQNHYWIMRFWAFSLFWSCRNIRKNMKYLLDFYILFRRLSKYPFCQVFYIFVKIEVQHLLKSYHIHDVA